MAKNIALRPELTSTGDLLRVGEVKEEVLRLMGFDQQEKLGLQALSLLTRIGWEGGLEPEGQLIANFFGIPWSSLQLQVQELVNKGLAVRQGRYRSASPFPIAVFMAQDTWDALGENILQLIDGLPYESGLEAFFERIADLGSHESVKKAVEHFLENSPRFQSVKTMRKGNNAKLLLYSSRVASQVAIHTLKNITDSLNSEELRQLTNHCPEIIWTLKELAWWEETFFDVGRLLLQFAEAEYKTFTGDASRAWKGLFQLRLGGTEVRAQERVILIKEALESSNLNRQLLAVEALDSALSTQETRSGGSEYQGGRIVRGEWLPETWGELWEAQRAGLELLDIAINDASPEVSQNANIVLLRSSHGLVFEGLHEEIVNRLISIDVVDDEHQRKVREAIESILGDQKIPLKNDLRSQLQERLEELTQKDFPTRLRRWVGEWTRKDWRANYASNDSLAEGEITALAEEAIQEPNLLKEELDWLASDEAKQAFAFGRRLGRLDESREWLNDIVDRAKSGIGYLLLSGYLMGQADAGEANWRDEILDKWTAEEEELAEAVFEATHAGPSSDHAAQRLIALVDNRWILPLRLGNLIYGRWIEGISLEAFSEILDRIFLEESEEGTERALELLRSRLGAHDEEKEALEDKAWELIERPITLGHERIADYDWAAIANIYIQNDPIRVANAIMASLERGNKLRLGDRHVIGQVLEEATRLSRTEAWELVGSYLLRNDEVSSWLEFELEDWYVSLFKPEYLLTWADANLPDGPEILAKLVSLGDDEPNPLARSLIIQHGPDGRVSELLAVKPYLGAFSGRRSAKLEGWLKIVATWTGDPEPNVRQWATRLAEGLSSDIENEKEREEEERW
jgi:hypothetical protein